MLTVFSPFRLLLLMLSLLLIACGSEKSEGRADHFVARADPEGHESEQQGICARGDRHGIGRAAEFGDLLLKPFDLWATDVASRSNHRLGGGDQFTMEWCILFGDIEEWNIHASERR